MTTVKLALTTEEVAAVSAMNESGWPTPVFLDDTASPTADQARSAVQRGARSLLARGLLAMTDGRAVLADEVRTSLSRMGSGHHVVVYPARGSALGDALYPLLYVHPAVDGESIIELDAGDGIRGITTMETTAVAEQLRTTLRAVFRRESVGDQPVVHVGSIGPDRRELTVIAPGEVAKFAVSPDGTVNSIATSPFFDAAVIDDLLAPRGSDQREQSV